MNPLSDPSSLTTTSNYSAGLPAARSETPTKKNFVYVRGINVDAPNTTSTIYLYYADASLNLLPTGWQTSGITYNAVSTNAAAIPVGSNGDIVATTTPSYIWTPPQAGHHYCLVAWARNGTDQGTAPTLPTISSWSDVGTFILEHPEVAWRNLQELAPAEGVYQKTVSVGNPPAGGNVSIGLSFENVPAGGTWQFTVPLSANKNLTKSGTTLSDQSYAVTFPVTLPANWVTSITFSYTPPANTPIPANASIEPLVTTGVGGDTLALVKERAPHRLLTKKADDDSGIKHEMVVGSVRYDLTS